jgi:hypothetical protein
MLLTASFIFPLNLLDVQCLISGFTQQFFERIMFKGMWIPKSVCGAMTENDVGFMTWSICCAFSNK